MGYTINWIGNNVIIRMDGMIGFNDIDYVNGLLYGDSRFENMRYQIFDLSDVQQFNLTARDFELLGILDKNSSIWNRSLKVAIVFTDEEMIKLMDYYKNEMKGTNWKIEVFRTFAEAEKWCFAETEPSSGI
jgi:hypothetical protein